MDTDFAQIHLVFLRKLLCPVLVVDIYGRPIASEIIVEESKPIRFVLDNLATFNIISNPKHPIVLGLEWFELHNPKIDWRKYQVSPTR